VTEIDLSRISVPWISPALEQPTMMDFGKAFFSSAKAPGLSRTSGAPKARTRVRAESTAGKLGTDHFFLSRS